jgi:hypothetical protein
VPFVDQLQQAQRCDIAGGGIKQVASHAIAAKERGELA